LDFYKFARKSLTNGKKLNQVHAWQNIISGVAHRLATEMLE
jgi:hypothetical protein